MASHAAKKLSGPTQLSLFATCGYAAFHTVKKCWKMDAQIAAKKKQFSEDRIDFDHMEKSKAYQEY